MKTLCIRVDGNKEIATGHIGRCLSVARVFSFPYTDNIISQNHAIFIVSDENSRKILEERFEKENEYEIIVLGTSYKDMESELPTLIDCISQKQASCLLIDSYFVTENYLKKLHEALKIKGCAIAYIDDLQALSCYDTDVIINYGVSQTPAKYTGVPSMLIGPKYTPLRTQFSQNNLSAKQIFAQNGLDIFISSGGIDSQNMSIDLINAIQNDIGLNTVNSKISIHVLTSKLNSHFEELISLSGKDENIHIYEGISNVAEIMNKCDIAVSAGGTTLCELCALGIPAISYLNADNQRKGITEFDSCGVIPYAGDVTESTKKDAVIDNILKYLNYLCSLSDEERSDIKAKMHSYIDGLGAKRIADELANH